MARIINRKSAPVRIGPKFGPYHLPLRHRLNSIRRRSHQARHA